MKVLLIRFSSAGDILLAHRLVDALKKLKHTVHFLTKEKFREQAEMTGASKVLSYKLNTPAEFFSAAKELSSGGYGAVIDLHSVLRSKLLALFIKSPAKISYAKSPVKRRLSVLFKWFLGGSFIPVADRYILAAAKVIPGLKAQARNPLTPSGKVRSIAVHLGAKWPMKIWPHYDALITMLASDKRLSISVTGVKDEVENYEKMGYHKLHNVKDLVGKTDFKGMVKTIGKSGLFIGNDTAAAHAAVLLGVPAVVFLGPTSGSFGFITCSDFHILEKKGLLCRPCHVHGGKKCPIGTFECLKSISAQEAYARVKKVLAGCK